MAIGYATRFGFQNETMCSMKLSSPGDPDGLSNARILSGSGNRFLKLNGYGHADTDASQRIVQIWSYEGHVEDIESAYQDMAAEVDRRAGSVHLV